MPLCLANLFGTHNSAITLANGYGTEDAYWQAVSRHLPLRLLVRLRLLPHKSSIVFDESAHAC